MDTREVEIVFQTDALISQYGCKPRKFPLEIARKYVDRGFARILPVVPDVNPPCPSLSLTSSEEIPTPEVVRMKEEEFVLPLVWISHSRPPSAIIQLAKKYGFSCTYCSPNSFSQDLLMRAKLTIVGSDLRGFRKPQKRQLRMLLFQKKIPYVLYCDSAPAWGELRWFVQAVLSACTVIISDMAVHKELHKELGDAISVFTIPRTPVEFWKKIGEVVE